MAKKKKVKKDDYPKSISKKAVTKAVENGDLVKRESTRNVLIDNLIMEVNELGGKILTLEQRIDRIVTAIGKAKSVKGL